jgi:hypothetical protein
MMAYRRYALPAFCLRRNLSRNAWSRFASAFVLQRDRGHFLSLDLPLEPGAKMPVFVFDNVLMAPIALPE